MHLLVLKEFVNLVNLDLIHTTVVVVVKMDEEEKDEKEEETPSITNNDVYYTWKIFL